MIQFGMKLEVKDLMFVFLIEIYETRKKAWTWRWVWMLLSAYSKCQSLQLLLSQPETVTSKV